LKAHLALAFALCICSTYGQECGRSPIGSRIGGGREAKPNVYPWMVALNNGLSISSFFCGASLISNRHLVTAAHCVSSHRWRSNAIRAHFGVHDRRRPEVVRTISKITTHPNYNLRQPLPPLNDIAVLELSSPVEFNDKIQPLCLGDTTAEPFDNLKFIGWGLSNAFSNPNVQLQELDPTELELHSCRRHIAAFFQQIGFRMGLHGQRIQRGDYTFLLNENHVCLKYENARVCPGDSGSPLMTLKDGKYYLAGISSFSLNCQPRGANNFPTGMCRASPYVNWIKSLM